MQEADRHPVVANDLDRWRDRLSIVVLVSMVAIAIPMALFVNALTVLQITGVIDLPARSIVVLIAVTVGSNLSLPVIYLKVLRAPP